MLSPNARARISDSARETPPHEIKRKRKALSCYDCRRRKLRCDREYPSCSRCRKAGHANSCSYDERPLQFEQAESGAPSSLKQSITTPQALSDWSSSKPVSHVRQILQVENRLPTLEASQTSGTWQGRGEVSTAARIRVPSTASSHDHTPPETVIFRGENFKTQYYGGSNPTSLIAHVRCLELFLIMKLMTVVSRTSIVLKGGDHPPLFTSTCSTRLEGVAGKMERREEQRVAFDRLGASSCSSCAGDRRSSCPPLL